MPAAGVRPYVNKTDSNIVSFQIESLPECKILTISSKTDKTRDFH